MWIAESRKVGVHRWTMSLKVDNRFKWLVIARGLLHWRVRLRYSKRQDTKPLNDRRSRRIVQFITSIPEARRGQARSSTKIWRGATPCHCSNLKTLQDVRKRSMVCLRRAKIKLPIGSISFDQRCPGGYRQSLELTLTSNTDGNTSEMIWILIRDLLVDEDNSSLWR